MADTKETNQAPIKAPRNEKCFAFFESLGSPRYGVAPMVDASELPFRMLCRKYGATMAWTPMLHSRLFIEQKNYRKKTLSTCPEDRPLAIQFCANDPQILLKAALQVQDECDAIDINLGCPQHIAKRGNYGAFLGEQWDIVKALVETLAQNLKIPVFCKIRILDTHERTIEYAKMIEAAGCSLLTVHGRTKEQKGHNQGLANLEWIRDIKNALSIPVLSNGNIRNFAEANEALAITGADGVMAACGLLKNLALFSGLEISPWQMAAEYLEFAEKYPVEFHLVRGHLFKLLNDLFHVYTDLREVLNKSRSVEECKGLVTELRSRVEQLTKEEIEEKIKNAKSANKEKRQREKESSTTAAATETQQAADIEALF